MTPRRFPEFTMVVMGKLLAPLGDMGGKLAEANTEGVAPGWLRTQIRRLRAAPARDIGIGSTGPTPEYHELLEVGEHLRSYGPSDDPRGSQKTAAAVMLLKKPHSLWDVIPTYRFPLEDRLRASPRDVDDALEFFIDNPSIAREVMRRPPTPLGNPDYVPYATQEHQGPLTEEDVERLLARFPKDRGRIIKAARQELACDLSTVDPSLVRKFLSSMLGIDVNPGVGQLVPLADVSFAAELAGINLSMCLHLPFVSRTFLPGLSPAIHGAAYSEDVNRELSLL